MSRARSIRFKKSRDKKGVFELDITSLLDILVILLIFLLKSYNTNTITMNIPKGITLPDSESKSVNNLGVMVQVSKEKIWVDSEEVLSSDNLPPKVYDLGGTRIIPLYDSLVKKKEEIDRLSKQEETAKPFSGLANLIVDKTIKFSYLKKVMSTCAEAGFREYKFVVRSTEQ